MGSGPDKARVGCGASVVRKSDRTGSGVSGGGTKTSGWRAVGVLGSSEREMSGGSSAVERRGLGERFRVN